jgi:hypothetical protein
MATFLLYLFETGLCLSVLFLVYLFFFRNETYFNFIRFYLFGSLIFSTVIPLVHVTWVLDKTDYIESPFQEIGRFRSYYTEIISMTDSEFGLGKYRNYKAAVFEENADFLHTKNTRQSLFQQLDPAEIKGGENEASNQLRLMDVSKIIFLLYGMGVFVFLIRFLFLLVWLKKSLASNPKEKQEKFNLVLMNQEIPPFSFFRYIFVSREATQLKEFEQVLAHEKVHARQLHSLDLMLAHGITVFQWFNPLVWQMQKAIKTTHEYIADSKVVSQGFELFDYQSLLLSQLISIRSVALVNNFNLISIKKRIAMMTKNKSGWAARLKALLIIPAAIISFFLFAHMTIKSPLISFSNFHSQKTSNLDGIWENMNSDSYGSLLYFKGNNLSILESKDNVNVVDLSFEAKKQALLLTNYGTSGDALNYELKGDNLKIWWNQTQWSEYHKTSYSNSAEVFMPKGFGGLNLPVLSETRVLDKKYCTYSIYIKGNTYYIDEIPCSLQNLEQTINQRVAKFNVIDKPYITTRIVMDKAASMKPVYDLYQTLRKMRLLKIAYAAYPSDNTSVLQYHATALPQMLPPLEKDGLEVLDREAIEDRIIDLTPSDDLKKMSGDLQTFIRNHTDYIAVFSWNNQTQWGDYLSVIDVSFKAIYQLRDNYTMEKYGLKYLDLPDNLQKEARKQYPMRISQKNTDEDK